MTTHIIEKMTKWAQEIPKQACFESVDKQVLTYRELAEQSTALANHLIDRYPLKEPVIVYGGLTQEMLITFIACLKSGRAYIPIDYGTPIERIRSIVETAQPELVVATETWELGGTPVLKQEQFNQIVAVATPEIPSVKWVKGAELVYIIFTSGTTGKPKGVQISYDNLVSFTDWIDATFSFARSQRYLCQAPFSFDLSVMDLYPALLSGGTLVAVAKQLADNFPVLFETIPRLHLNVWISTPSWAEICLLDPNFNGDVLSELTHFLFCGEELPRSVAAKLLTRFPAAKVFNTYGPTEATVAVTSVEITPTILAKYDRLPLGKAKADTRLLIMDEKRQLLPLGEMGEVVIVGPSVSQGYLNQGDKTSEVFFDYEGEAAYGTGDAGYLQNELLFYQGRLDFQVKWHGYRLELGDIDHHLLALEEIRNACVVAKYKDNKVQQLIAYVVLTDKIPTDKRGKIKELKAQLEGRLMAYMIPQKFNFVEQLPLSTNGKVDRKKLMNEVNN